LDHRWAETLQLVRGTLNFVDEMELNFAFAFLSWIRESLAILVTEIRG
jgi:hypothetical protein